MEKLLNMFAAALIVAAILFVLIDYGFYKHGNEGLRTKQEIKEAIREKESTVLSYKQEKISLKLELERVESDIELAAQEKTENGEQKLLALRKLRVDLKEQISRVKAITTAFEGDLELLLEKSDFKE